MKAKHTPGPWECDTGGQPIIINGPEEGESNVVALVYDNTMPNEQYSYGEERAAANARLIEAAPAMEDMVRELLAALTTDDGGPDSRPVVVKAKALLAKVEGRR